MNRIYRTVYNASAGAYVAVSELCRSGGRVPSSAVLLAGAVLSAATPAARADAVWDGTAISPHHSQYHAVGDPDTLNIIAPAATHIVPAAQQAPAVFITQGSGKTFNFKGDFTSQGGAYGAFAVGSSSVATVNFEGNLNHTSGTEATGWAPMLIDNQYTQVANFKGNVTLNGSYNYNSGNSSGGAGMYGVVSGSSVNSGNGHPIGSSEKYSRINFNNLTVNLADTQQSFAVTNPVLINGIRAIQGAHAANSGTGSAGWVTVNGKLDINLNADRGIGIYASGNRFNQGAADAVGTWATPKVVLNGDSNITLNAPDARKTTALTVFNLWDSHGIKLGKVRNAGEGAGILESNGRLTIDTTRAPAGGGIKLLRNSVIAADGANSVTTVKTNGYALQIGGNDDFLYSRSGRVNEQAGSHHVEARFKNAVFETAGSSRDRTITGSQPRTDLIFVDQGQHNAQIAFSGSQTRLTAHSDGYIVNVSGNYTAPNTRYFTNTYDRSGNEIEGADALKPSAVDFRATDAGQMTGLVAKNTLKPHENQTAVADKHAALNLTLDNGFTWHLNKNGAETAALFDRLDLRGGAVLNGGYDAAAANAYTLKARIGDPAGNTLGTVANTDAVITLANGRSDDTLTIDGNYTGSGSAVVKMDTEWNAPGDAVGGNSASDLLIIKGTAAGRTQVLPVAGGTDGRIKGNVQQLATVINTVPVVKVEQGAATAADAFYGTAQTEGAVEVQLARRDQGGTAEYYWTMKAAAGKIYTPAVSGYLNMPEVNAGQAWASVRTLHERRGENRFLLPETGERGQTWARLIGGRQSDGRGRLGFSTRFNGLQIGQDFDVGETADGRSISGLYLAYVRARTRFDDQGRTVAGKAAADTETGSGRSHAVSLGLNHTRYAENGGYWDFVGQLSHFRNRYAARDGRQAAQTAWGVLLSAEIGRPYCRNGGTFGDCGKDGGLWSVEPQAQLVYQGVNGRRFHDGIRSVGQNARHSLTGRIGLRLSRHKLPDNGASAEERRMQVPVFYAVGNLWHRFGNRPAATVGTERVADAVGNSWWEIGAGAQLPLGRRSHLYTDWRYERGFGGGRYGWRGDVAWKYTWQ